MHLFYQPNIESEGILDENESSHAIKVLRLKVGDFISILDGKGKILKSVITKADFRKCEVSIKEETFTPPSLFWNCIAIAPTKNADRTEWFVEKAVEIGVDEICFIKCDRSERKNVNLDRIRKVAISAMKQSLKSYMPKISELSSFPSFLKECNSDLKFVAHLGDGERKYLQNCVNVNSSTTVLIGPEGDFTDAEIAKAFETGFVPVSLGQSRLRTETAGIVACHILNLVNNP
ncbi:MAG TPA: 16S rRNA (uracil(1498)-N(3))-methyltransferase [Cytophagaceae bacterium]|jgi:16S rRNA (uracil1498-N3)-methyltransferase